MFKKGDFHSHSNASDGKFAPSMLPHFAKGNSVDIMAITDHDTTAGVEEAVLEGDKIGVKVIRGIELSTLHDNENIHILGFFKDSSYKTEHFQNFLKEMDEYRVYRAEKIVNNLFELYNIKLDYRKILNEADGIVARPHLARAIIEAGYSYSWDYIFNNLIGNNCPAYIPNKKLSVAEGINLLKSVNAMVVLAHPVLIKKTNIEEILSYPFDGIESIYYMNKPEDNIKYNKLAKDYNLIVTAGSDFHGISKSDGSHALEIGAVYLEQKGINLFLDKLNSIS